jgi:hypothetical protein
MMVEAAQDGDGGEGAQEGGRRRAGYGVRKARVPRKKERRGLGQWKKWRGERAEGASRRTEGRRGHGWGAVKPRAGEATRADGFTYQVFSPLRTL